MLCVSQTAAAGVVGGVLGKVDSRGGAGGVGAVGDGFGVDEGVVSEAAASGVDEVAGGDGGVGFGYSVAV